MVHDHHTTDTCCTPKKRVDFLLWGSLAIIVLAYAVSFQREWMLSSTVLSQFSGSIQELVERMWWGIALGILSVGIIGAIPREVVTSVLGRGGTINGLFRATAAGVMLDLCSHGILLVGMKLYERGASLGQLFAFLIASPWNSLSLTLILWSLVGFKWMAAFLILSLIIALISGFIVNRMVISGRLPQNPNATFDHNNCSPFKHLWLHIKSQRPTLKTPITMFRSGLKDSTMILRWIVFGIVLAALMRTFVSVELFTQLFGPTLAGLGATLLFATILEVCSEGSLPVATDMLIRAKAAGNSFAFLMTGVSTDYTEIMSLKETTGRWKMAFLLPIVTLPQVIIVALILNATSL